MSKQQSSHTQTGRSEISLFRRDTVFANGFEDSVTAHDPALGALTKSLNEMLDDFKAWSTKYEVEDDPTSAYLRHSSLLSRVSSGIRLRRKEWLKAMGAKARTNEACTILLEWTFEIEGPDFSVELILSGDVMRLVNPSDEHHLRAVDMELEPETVVEDLTSRHFRLRGVRMPKWWTLLVEADERY